MARQYSDNAVNNMKSAARRIQSYAKALNDTLPRLFKHKSDEYAAILNTSLIIDYSRYLLDMLNLDYSGSDDEHTHTSLDEDED